MIAVVATPRTCEALSADTLHPTRSRFVGVDRVYRLYVSDTPHRTTEPFCAYDVGGTSIVEGRTFATFHDAQQWVYTDDRQRQLLHMAAGARM
jgi:hypothetical protein